jgi:hypothetical protein
LEEGNLYEDRAVKYLIEDLDIRIYFLMGLIAFVLFFGPITFFILTQSTLSSTFQMCGIFVILGFVLLAFLMGLAGASYVKEWKWDYIEIRSRNFAIVAVVLLVYVSMLFLYYLAISSLLSGSAGFEALLLPIMINIFAVPLTLATFSHRIRISRSSVYYRTFREEKTIDTKDIFHVSPPLKDLGGMKALTIYSKSGVIRLDNIYHSPSAKNLVRELLRVIVGEEIFDSHFDFRTLDKETRELIEKEKLALGGKGLRATAWSNEAIVVMSGLFILILLWPGIVATVYHFLEGNRTEFLVAFGFSIILGSLFIWILLLIIKFWNYEFKIYRSSPGANPKEILEGLLMSGGLNYRLLSKNKIPAPIWFDYIWKVNDEFHLRFRHYSKEDKFWISIGPMGKNNKETVKRLQSRMDDEFLSIV